MDSELLCAVRMYVCVLVCECVIVCVCAFVCVCSMCVCAISSSVKTKSDTSRGTGIQTPHSAQRAALWGGLVTCRVLFARAPVFGLCFFASVNTHSPHRRMFYFHRHGSPTWLFLRQNQTRPLSRQGATDPMTIMIPFISLCPPDPPSPPPSGICLPSLRVSVFFKVRRLSHLPIMPRPPPPPPPTHTGDIHLPSLRTFLFRTFEGC